MTRALTLSLSRAAGEGTERCRRVPSPTVVGEGQGEGRVPAYFFSMFQNSITGEASTPLTALRRA